MKKIATILTSLVMACLCVNCASAKGGNKEQVSETRSVSAFHSIEMESIAGVYFTQSDTYSLRVEGEKEWVDLTRCTVKNGKLLITWAKERKKENKQAGKWTFHLPQCTRFTGSCFRRSWFL